MELVDLQQQLQEKWVVIFWMLALGLCMMRITYRLGFYKQVGDSKSTPPIQSRDVAVGFIFFLFTQIILVPSLLGLLIKIQGSTADIRQNALSIYPIAVIFFSFGTIMLVQRFLSPGQRRFLWNPTHFSWYFCIGQGICIVCAFYPLVIAWSELISLGSTYIFPHEIKEQIVLQNLRDIKEHPYLFSLTSVLMVTLVPITEEFLFRGLLQSWLKNHLKNSFWAISGASTVFALFHYLPAQGLSNIELITTLFLLSCMIGFIYERRRSLWVGIGFHGFFNCVSLLLSFYS
jgi:membrane protease YdiL (CAAX protease family)